jgi:hypothetical protein
VDIPDSVTSIGFSAFSTCGCEESLYHAGAKLCHCKPKILCNVSRPFSPQLIGHVFQI